MATAPDSSGVWGGIEGGGTKFVCMVGSGPDDVRAERTLPTTTPAETLAAALAFFREQCGRVGALRGLGIGSFGPVDLRAGSPTHGYITTTPKPGWANTEVVGVFERGLGVPVAFDTDVNVAAIGEWRWGAAQGLDTFLYLTVGTGIGGGGLVGGRLMHGLVHPEIGHLRLPRDPARDLFPGACPFHGDCLEGLASGPALRARWKQDGESLPADHPAWTLQAHYLALGLVNLICTVSPQRIVVGGGVMARPELLPLVRREVQGLLNGYVVAPEIQEGIDQYIVPPRLGGRSGVLGALALAQLPVNP
jgi:fructokinase